MQIDKLSRTPIYEQIIEGLTREILTGLLPEGSQIPSVRELSMQLSINPNTIQKAYSELERRGLTASAPGIGRFVAAGAVEKLRCGSAVAGLDSLREAARALALAGVPEEEAHAAVRQAYQRAGSNADTLPVTETIDKHNDKGEPK